MSYRLILFVTILSLSLRLEAAAKTFYLEPKGFCTGLHHYVRDVLGSIKTEDSKAAIEHKIFESWLTTSKELVPLELVPLAPIDKSSTQRMYISSHLALAAALGVDFDAVVLRDVDELRYVTQAMRGLQIIVAASDASVLTPDTLARLILVAKARDMVISTFWLGGAREMGHEHALRLAQLAGQTGGVFMDANLLKGQGQEGRFFGCTSE